MKRDLKMAKLNLNLEELTISDVKFLTLVEVAEQLKVTRSTMYTLIKRGFITPYVKVGGTCVWPRHEVMAFNQAILLRLDSDGREDMVNQLMAFRENLASQPIIN